MFWGILFLLYTDEMQRHLWNFCHLQVFCLFFFSLKHNFSSKALWVFTWATQPLLPSLSWNVREIYLKAWKNTSWIVHRGVVSSFLLSCHFLPISGWWQGQQSWPHSGKCWPEPAPPPPSVPSPLHHHRPAHPGSERGRGEWQVKIRKETNINTSA